MNDDNLVKIDEKWTPESIPPLKIDWSRAGEKVFEPRMRVCFATDYLLPEEKENQNEEDT